MSGPAVILGEVKTIHFGELRVENSITGGARYRMLTIASDNGDTFSIKLCGDIYNLKAIHDEELEAFLEAEGLSPAENDYFCGKEIEMNGPQCDLSQPWKDWPGDKEA